MHLVRREEVGRSSFVLTQLYNFPAVDSLAEATIHERTRRRSNNTVRNFNVKRTIAGRESSLPDEGDVAVADLLNTTAVCANMPRRRRHGRGGIGINLPFGGFNVGWGRRRRRHHRSGRGVLVPPGAALR